MSDRITVSFQGLQLPYHPKVNYSALKRTVKVDRLNSLVVECLLNSKFGITKDGSVLYIEEENKVEEVAGGESKEEEQSGWVEYTTPFKAEVPHAEVKPTIKPLYGWEHIGNGVFNDLRGGTGYWHVASHTELEKGVFLSPTLILPKEYWTGREYDGMYIRWGDTFKFLGNGILQSVTDPFKFSRASVMYNVPGLTDYKGLYLRNLQWCLQVSGHFVKMIDGMSLKTTVQSIRLNKAAQKALEGEFTVIDDSYGYHRESDTLYFHGGRCELGRQYTVYTSAEGYKFMEAREENFIKVSEVGPGWIKAGGRYFLSTNAGGTIHENKFITEREELCMFDRVAGTFQYRGKAGKESQPMP